EVGLDLALAASVYSARTGLSVPQRGVIAGELTLAAEVMPIKRLDGRLKTAANLGFDFFAGPPAENPPIPAGLAYHGAKTLREAISLIFG
ncbi:MAG: DNA repair protein RadA, partial [Spirochaetaceae bacterium]|nr:DNA repair protein RadA [Spirochaetaceae bacterium]